MFICFFQKKKNNQHRRCNQHVEKRFEACFEKRPLIYAGKKDKSVFSGVDYFNHYLAYFIKNITETVICFIKYRHYFFVLFVVFHIGLDALFYF